MYLTLDNVYEIIDDVLGMYLGIEDYGASYNELSKIREKLRDTIRNEEFKLLDAQAIEQENENEDEK